MGRFARFSDKGQGKALIELALAYSPNHAIREYVTNGLDARINGYTEDISVIVNPKDKRLIISDNGTGILPGKFERLPIEIGESGKAGHIDSRGEKALGLLAFGSLGNAMHIITRHYQERDYIYQRWEIKQSKGDIPVSNDEILTDKQVKDFFYGSFSSGTRVIIDRIDPHIFNKTLTNANIKSWLRELYDPAIQKKLVNITLGRYDSRGREKTELLKPFNYQRSESSVLIDETIEIDIKNEKEPGKLEIKLFVDPNASNDKVGVYSKDVQVNDSIADKNHFPEFKNSPIWTSGKVSGYINDMFNTLVLGRDGIERKSNAFKAWYQAILKIEEQIRPIVEEKKKLGKKITQDKYIKKAFDAISDVWKDLQEFGGGNSYESSENGQLINVLREKGELGGEKNPGTSKPRKRTKKKLKYAVDENGRPKRVRSIDDAPFATPQPIPFSLSERDSRSKLEEKLGVRPILYINSSHQDYESRASSKDKTDFVRYVINIIAKEAAQHEVNSADEIRGIKDSSEIVHLALSREEEIRFLALKKLGIT